MRSTVLNVKSEYAPGSLVRIEALLDRVHELKMDTAGLADRATLLGIPHFLSAARRRGLRVLIGVELPLVSSVPEEAAAGVTFPLIVRVGAASRNTSDGLRMLHRLVERAGHSAAGGLTLEALATELRAAMNPASSERTFELIAQSPGPTGEVSVRILRGQMDLAERLALQLAEVFGRSSFFLGVGIYGGGNYLAGNGLAGNGLAGKGVAGNGGRASGRPTELELRLARETVLLARRLELNVAASNEVDHLHVDDAHARGMYDRMMASAAAGGHRVLPPDVPTHVRTGEEFEQLFAECPEALEGAELLADRCRIAPTARVLAPLAGLLVDPSEDDGCGEASALRRLERRLAVGAGGAGARGPEVAARQRNEMEIIRRHGLAVPLLLLERTFPGGQLGLDGATGAERIAWLPDGFLAGSWVAYRLGLTPVDPIRHRLPVRFPAGWLNDTPRGAMDPAEDAEPAGAAFHVPVEVSPGRDSDLDARLESLFGAASLALPVRVERLDAGEALFEAALFEAVGTEAAARDAASNISPALLDRAVEAARRLPGRDRKEPEAIVAIFQNDPHLARAYLQDELVPAWFDTARRIVGLPRRVTPDTGTRFLSVRATPPVVPGPKAPGRQAPGGARLRPSIVDARPVARLTTEQTGFESLLVLRLETPRVTPDRAQALNLMRVLGRTQPPSNGGTPRSTPVHSPSTETTEVSMSLATVPVTGIMTAPFLREERARSAERSEPLAVIEREEAVRVPSLRDATDAVALNRLVDRRRSLVRVFAERRAAGAPVDCGDPGITRILAPTHGLLIYDEQFVDIAVRLAGFSSLQAEAFRQVLAVEEGVSSSDPGITTWRIRFVQGAVGRGLTTIRAEEYFASLKQAAGGTVPRGACVAEAMRLLREAFGFGAVRDGRKSTVIGDSAGTRVAGDRGRVVVPIRRSPGQLALPWLELIEAANAAPMEAVGLRRRA